MNAQRWIALVSAVSLGLGLEALWAVPFEQVYGNTLHVEQALKGAAPVQVCPGGGYISAGFTLHQGGRTDLDVYVVRTVEMGAGPAWERTYDLNNALGDDVGTSIREIQIHPQQGFIVTGTTRAPGQADRDVLLLRLDCDGNLLWNQTLRTLADLTATPSDDEARDVIETSTGALAGDFVIAGSSRSMASGPQDPNLARWRARTFARRLRLWP